MIAEIISTGDEIRSGALVDTNTAHIADRLELTGVTVTRHSAVGDDKEQLFNLFREVGERADIALVTGGLGPTVDDLTSEIAARVTNTPLILNQTALASIREYFGSRGLEMPDSNKKQALFPENSEILENPVGTAPGFAVTIGKCWFFFIPGVPHEMRRMLTDHVLPRVDALLGKNRPVNRIRTIASFGLTESKTDELLEDLPHHFPEIKLGLRAKFPEIQVKLYGSGKDANLLESRLNDAAAWVCQQLGNKVFSTDGQPMAAVVGAMLREKGATVAVGESCTGGLISSLLTDIPGSSDYFLLGAVTYANVAKERILGVLPETLATDGAVSEATVREMADGVRKSVNATYGIATSGIAGPTGGTDEKPVGTVCIGLSGPQGVTSGQFIRAFINRDRNRKMFAMLALDMLRRELSALTDV